MHPEIVRDAPGACPICGMALEPRTVTLDDAPNPELARHGPAVPDRRGAARCTGRRCWRWATWCSAWGSAAGSTSVNWIGLALATPVVLWAGWPFFERAWASIVNRSPNMFTLIAIGVGAAYVYSVVATLAPGLFPEGFRVHGVVETYFDTAGRHGARAARPGAGAARGQDQHGDPAVAGPGAEDRAHRPRRARRRRAARPRPRRRSCCASGRAKRFPSTAWSSRAAARSTNRW